MAVEWHSPYSAVIARIGHDPDTNELHVEWVKGGRVSIYSDVDAEQFDIGRKSHSVGGWLHNVIKVQHPHRYAE